MDRQKGRLRKLIKQNDELATIIRNAYRTADTNGDGIIQKEEFRLLCESLNLQTIKRSKDPRFFDNLWTLLDVNGDDSMDVREFELFVSDYFSNDIVPEICRMLGVRHLGEVSNDQLVADC